MNIDIRKLRSKIQIYASQKEKLFLKDSTIKIASILASKKINNLIFIKLRSLDWRNSYIGANN